MTELKIRSLLALRIQRKANHEQPQCAETGSRSMEQKGR